MPSSATTIFTQKMIDGLAPGPRDRFYWDAQVRGLGVRVKPSGVATYIIQYRNIDGRTRRLALDKASSISLKAARRDARTKLAGISHGADPSADRKRERAAQTMEELAAYYLERYAVERRLSVLYRRDCAGMLREIVLPRWGKLKVKAIARDDIRSLHFDLRGTPIRANRILALLSKMFSLAVENGARADNPCKGIERYPESRREHFFQSSDLERLFARLNADGDQEQANGIRLLIVTGARIGEVLAAEWSHFDLDAGVWTKPPSKTKQRRVHRAPLSGAAIEILKRMRKTRRGVSPYLFPSPTDPKKHREDFRKYWERIRKEACLGDARLYDARHTFASHLLMGGVPLGVVGALLGHSQPATTARYAHVGDSTGRHAADVMGKLISGLVD